MDKKQAEQIAEAVLEPEREAQRRRESERQRLQEHQRLQRRRGKIALWFLLAGVSAGALAAYYGDRPVAQGVATGALIGITVGWLVAAWRVRGPAA